MHIAYISTEYPHSSLSAAGGIGSFIKLMAKSLTKRNHQVTIFICLSNKDKIWFDDKVRIVEIKQVKPSVLSPFKNRFKINNTIQKHIKTTKIDVVEAPDWEGLHAFCNFKIPLITRIHGSVNYFNFLQGFKNSQFLYYLEKRAIKKSNHTIAVSNFAGKLTQKVFGFKKFKFETIYNGIDVSVFNAKTIESKQEQKVLYFGSLMRKKGAIALAHIFNALHLLNPKAKLILVGKDTFDAVEKTSTFKLMQNVLTPAAFNQVQYKGVVPYEEMAKEIATSNLCVFPSFAEAFPISWLEAMAMQKPIVASSIGWAKESIKNEKSGLLEHPNNYKEFAKKIDTLLNNTEFAAQLGNNAQKRVLSLFNQNKLVEDNIKMYKRVLQNE